MVMDGHRIVDVNGVDLCVDTTGDAADPAILLISGMGGSMDWWEEEFCQRLAAGGRFVIRYDHRDTGQSVSYPAGAPGYTGADLAADVVGVLDAVGRRSAHLAGISMGGALAQRVALAHPDRVDSLVLISTSPGEPACGRLDEIAAPALVIHGTADPLFPFGHAEALARGIARAELLPLEGVGHQVPPRAWWTSVITAMLREHAGGKGRLTPAPP
jgi:pimeloyl-ACP methyl ester carboxylesterase